MKKDQKLAICEKYVWVISKLLKANNRSVFSWDEKRTEIHEQIIETFNCDPVKLQVIVSRLDVWIALPDLCEKDDIRKYGRKLYDLLESDFFMNADYGDICEMSKKLGSLYLDDDNFKGWTAFLKI